jgi:hypothetical protein
MSEQSEQPLWHASYPSVRACWSQIWGLEETDAVARRCWTCFTKAYVVPAVIRAPRRREAGRWNFERGVDGNLIRGRDGFGGWEDHDVGGEVMGVLTSSFWGETSAEVLEVSEHFSL